MNPKIQRAVTALRETADALDDLPPMMRRTAALFSMPMVNIETLRDEAQWLEHRAAEIDRLSDSPKSTDVFDYPAT